MVSPRLTLQTVYQTLKREYHPPSTFLNYKTPFQLLVATILSAQCTDVRVNIVTKQLFKKYKTPADFAMLKQETLEKGIHSTGFFRMKSKNILRLSQIVLREHGGKIPETMEQLVTLPGVGRKTASIILSVAFGKHEGIAVDTHVMRLSRRLGLTRHRDQNKIEVDLMKALPKKDWPKINPLLISHGRAVCTARNRKCEECVFKKECPSSLVAFTAV